MERYRYIKLLIQFMIPEDSLREIIKSQLKNLDSYEHGISRAKLI